jgi:hypothetical protein
VAFETKYGGKFGTIKEHQEKARAACREVLGVDYPFESKKIQEIIKSTNLERYGNEVYLASETGRAHMMELYGSPNYFHSQHFKDFMMETYGAEHAMQCPELIEKAMLSAFSTKDYFFPSGKISKVQGYEHFALDDLLEEEEIDEDDIVSGFKNVPYVDYEFEGKTRRYFPDIYIKSLDLIIEVKSVWTYHAYIEKNHAKFRACMEIYNFELWVYDPKGKRVTRTSKFE